MKVKLYHWILYTVICFVCIEVFITVSKGNKANDEAATTAIASSNDNNLRSSGSNNNVRIPTVTTNAVKAVDTPVVIVPTEIKQSTTEIKQSTTAAAAAGVSSPNDNAAVDAWGKSLHDHDYDTTYWTGTLKLSPQYTWRHYIKLLSEKFNSMKSNVNFMLVGACDGTHDATISDTYFPNRHWHGIFVEPMDLNIKDLTQILSDKGVNDRSLVVQAAVTNSCPGPTITVKFPTYEETKGTSVPHWLRRQIGGIVKSDEKVKDPAWKTKDVKCMTGIDLIKEWNSNSITKKRLHVLKIDAEGFDYEVLASFLSQSAAQSELPLIINFEAKSMGNNYTLAKELLLRRGYAISEFGNDGFAMLKYSHFY